MEQIRNTKQTDRIEVTKQNQYQYNLNEQTDQTEMISEKLQSQPPQPPDEARYFFSLNILHVFIHPADNKVYLPPRCCNPHQVSSFWSVRRAEIPILYK